MVLTALLALAAPAAAHAARYHGRAAGNSHTGPGLVPSHHFGGGDTWPVQFRDSDGSRTRYRVCAWMHGQRKGCASGRTGRRNRWHTIVSSEIWDPSQRSKIIYRWYVDGARVASWSVTFGAENA